MKEKNYEEFLDEYSEIENYNFKFGRVVKVITLLIVLIVSIIAINSFLIPLINVDNNYYKMIKREGNIRIYTATASNIEIIVTVYVEFTEVNINDDIYKVYGMSDYDKKVQDKNIIKVIYPEGSELDGVYLEDEGFIEVDENGELQYGFYGRVYADNKRVLSEGELRYSGDEIVKLALGILNDNNGKPKQFIRGLVLMILSCLILKYPIIGFKIENIRGFGIWKRIYVEGDEPSGWYLFINEISSYILIGVAIFLIIESFAAI